MVYKFFIHTEQNEKKKQGKVIFKEKTELPWAGLKPNELLCSKQRSLPTEQLADSNPKMSSTVKQQ